ncbi:MAG: magnesium/cobalt transporter CorA [Nanoarchaeota archaeon]|nr:magnesium/cobalt transporter CorA [Nanoarchaeota archaeon]
MSRILKKMSKKAGLMPGSLIYLGDKSNAPVKITVFYYNEKKFQEREVRNVEDCFKYKEKTTITWINIDGIHRPDIVESIGKHYKIHPTILEDIMSAMQRPKAEIFDSHIFIVLNMLSYTDSEKKITSEQVSIILGKNFVISFQEGLEGDVFDSLRERIRAGTGHIRKAGADYLAYSLMDAVIDNYFIVLEKMGDETEVFEERLMKEPKHETLYNIHRLKREMLFMRKSVWPLRDMVGILLRGESRLISASTRIYLRDLYDHTVRIIDTVETYRDMLSGMIDLYLSTMSNKMSEVMKILTIIATIFIPLTFIVGVYGMNFNTGASPFNMPELNWYWGYAAVWVVMIAITISMLAYFRKRKWL